MKDKLISNIKQIINNNNITKISCNGHSSGGAMASIAIIDIYKDLGIGNMNGYISMECMTFGSPRIGNNEFINIYNNCVNRSIRIVNWNDIIQHVPPPIPYLYKHIHKPLVLNSYNNDININIYKYLKINHGITKYIKNII